MKRLLALLAFCTLPLALAHAAEAQAAASPASAASAAKAPAKPASAVATNCTTLRQRYIESANCYGPFLNANGTRKPGAYEACGEPAPYPARECSSQPLR